MSLNNSHQKSSGRTPRRIVLLGATGSVGRSTVDLLEREPEKFSVVAVAGGRDAEGLAQIARATKAKFAAVRDEAAYKTLKDALSGSGVEVAAGPHPAGRPRGQDLDPEQPGADPGKQRNQ